MRSSNIQHCAEEHFQTITKDKRKKAKNRAVLENAFVFTKPTYLIQVRLQQKQYLR